MIPLPTLKQHLRVTHSLEDSLINEYEAAAVSMLGRRRNEYWGEPREVKLSQHGSPIKLTGPVLEVVSVLDKDDDPVEFELIDRTVRVRGGSRSALYTVTYKHGIVLGSEQPFMRQAVLLTVAHWYANRSPVVAAAGTSVIELPHAVTELVPRIPVVA